MQIKAEQNGGALVLRVMEPRIDAAGAIGFKEAVRAATAAAGAPVILDLSQVEFLDSSGLGALVAVLKLLGRERPLELAGLTAPVARVLRLTRMDSIFTLHPQVPGIPALPKTG